MASKSLFHILLAITLLALARTNSHALITKDVSQDRFQQLLKDHKSVLVAFTTFSLESLESFNSNFEVASEAVSTPFFTIDCSIEADLCREQDVTGYPTLRLFKGGNKTIRYREKKTSRSIISFMKKQELPPVSEVHAENLAEFKRMDSIVIIGYLPESDLSIQTAFRSVASRHHNSFVFGLVTDAAVAQAEGVSTPSIACYKNTDGDNRVITGSASETEIETFLDVTTKPVIGEVTERTIDSYLRPGNKLTAYIFLPATAAASQHDQLLHTLTPIAKEFENVVKFGIADAVEFGPMAYRFGLKKDVWPAFVLAMGVRNQVFLFKQGKRLTGEAVERMLMAVLEGRMQSGETWGEDEVDDSFEAGKDEL